MSQPNSTTSLSFGPAWMRPKINNDPKPELNSHEALNNSKIVPPNEGGKRYSLDEMFEILETMRKNGDLVGEENEEFYKYKNPQDVLHFLIQKNKVDQLGNSVNELPLKESLVTPTSSLSSPGLNSSLLNNLIPNKLITQTPPPGLFPMITPENIMWFYLDPSNQQQGPFSGTMMQNWLSLGYLTPTLQIRRAEETGYYPLNQFINTVQNPYQPFLVSLPVIQNFTTSNFFSNSTVSTPTLTHNNNGSGFFQNSQTTSPNAWGRSGLIPQTWTKDVPSRLPNQSPLYSNGLSNSIGNLSLENGSLLNNNETVLLNNNLADNGLNDNIIDNPLINNVVKEASPDLLNEIPLKNPSKFEESELIPQENHISSVLLNSVLKEEEIEPIKSKSPISRPKQLIPAKSTKKLAPWANKIDEKPSRTLKEIQAIEAAEHAKEQKLIQEKKSAMLKESLKEESQHQQQQQRKPASGLPASSGWASVGKSTIVTKPTKTLLDIQREETAKLKAANVKPTNSIAASLTNNVENDKSWTVVNKKIINSKVAPVPTFKTVATNGSKLTPAQLRTVSTPTNNLPTTVTPTNTNSKQRREFLAWCRSELKDLNGGVTREEVLKMFFMFPCSQDSRDLISDTIYSSSKTINGRRFADEFIKRRKLVEKNQKINWDDALSINPDDETEDEWVTSTKKKNRR